MLNLLLKRATIIVNNRLPAGIRGQFYIRTPYPGFKRAASYGFTGSNPMFLKNTQMIKLPRGTAVKAACREARALFFNAGTPAGRTFKRVERGCLKLKTSV